MNQMKRVIVKKQQFKKLQVRNYKKLEIEEPVKATCNAKKEATCSLNMRTLSVFPNSQESRGKLNSIT